MRKEKYFINEKGAIGMVWTYEGKGEKINFLNDAYNKNNNIISNYNPIDHTFDHVLVLNNEALVFNKLSELKFGTLADENQIIVNTLTKQFIYLTGLSMSKDLFSKIMKKAINHEGIIDESILEKYRHEKICEVKCNNTVFDLYESSKFSFKFDTDALLKEVIIHNPESIETLSISQGTKTSALYLQTELLKRINEALVQNDECYMIDLNDILDSSYNVGGAK